MSTYECSNRQDAHGDGGKGFVNWCSSKFDQINKKQHIELDNQRRARMVVRQQKLIYRAAIHQVLYYSDGLRAYRKDRFDGFTKKPGSNGVIFGYWGFSARNRSRRGRVVPVR